MPALFERPVRPAPATPQPTAPEAAAPDATPRRLGWLAPLAAAVLLAACGGAGAPSAEGPAAAVVQPSAADASRFLAQATFGPTEASIAALSAQTYGDWINAQFAAPQTLHRAYMDQRLGELPVGSMSSQGHLLESFWKQAVTGQDPLRQRVAFALSQIFVVSFNDGNVAQYPRGVASYLDMLGAQAFGNYRDLLEAVTLHPMMGLYLSHLRNQKENTATGRVPDENYAREVMQLFSIGLYQLDAQGIKKPGPNGQDQESYTGADIQGLARVFTGFSWYAGPNEADRTTTRFQGGAPHPDRDWQPMSAYPAFHSTLEKRFLGTTIPAQTTADPRASLKIALDTLFNHPNVGPFIGRQLIQRLVKSNPSPAYVGRVAAAFADNGAGVRGDMKAVLRAVLLDAEARSPAAADAEGKLREPVLRLAHWMRAFNATSASGNWTGIDNTDDAATRLGQTPMRSPSVFNFYRPGYVPPRTDLANNGLVSPELQLAHEVSVAGYLNYLQTWVAVNTGRDVRQNYEREMALADKPSAGNPTELIERMNLLLMGGRMTDRQRAALMAALISVTIPAPTVNSAGTVTNQAAIDAARRNRASIAIFLTMASPDYLAQP